MELTNRTKGPKAIQTTDRGYVILQPGATEDLNVSEENLAAMDAAKLLDEDVAMQSIGERMEELASTGGTTAAAPDAGDGLTVAADDPEVNAMVDGNKADDLAKIADDENVEVANNDSKRTVARKIIAARRAGEQQ